MIRYPICISKSLLSSVIFIDDIVLAFSNASKLDDFFTWINNLHPTIKFTTQFDKDCVAFLDTEVFKNEEGKLSERNFAKPTDQNSVLHYNSYHTKALHDTLLYGHFLRLKKNSSKTADYIKGTAKLWKSLIERGYLEDVILQTRRRADKQKIWELLWEKKSITSNQFTFALQYMPLANGIKRIILKY